MKRRQPPVVAVSPTTPSPLCNLPRVILELVLHHCSALALSKLACVARLFGGRTLSLVDSCVLSAERRQLFTPILAVAEVVVPPTLQLRRLELDKRRNGVNFDFLTWRAQHLEKQGRRAEAVRALHRAMFCFIPPQDVHAVAAHEMRRRTAQSSLARIVVEGMAAAPSDSAVQMWGISSLGFMAREQSTVVAASGGSPPPGPVAIVLRAGGVAAVANAMRAHRRVTKIQELGCEALGRFATHMHQHGENQIGIVAAGGVSAAVAAMRAHPDVEKIQQLGCYALGHLATGAAIEVAAAGGAEAVITAMCAHTAIDEVQEQGCYALCVLSWTSCTKERIIAAGGVEAVTAAWNGVHDGTELLCGEEMDQYSGAGTRSSAAVCGVKKWGKGALYNVCGVARAAELLSNSAFGRPFYI